MKVLLANDTGLAEHMGCRGVSDAHARLLGRSGHQVIHRLFRGALQRHDAATDEQIVRNLSRDSTVLRMLEDVDAVVVNGEGTIHHGAGRPWLGLLEVAQRLGRLTLLVNSVFQETSGFDETLARLDEFTVRESLSADHARGRGLKVRIVADSYLAARFSSSAQKPLSGVVVTDWHPQRADVAAVIETFLQENSCHFAPLRGPDCEARWAALPRDLQSAEIVITARHHGVCAAIIAGRPFVALPSNTHKIEGMLEDLGVPHLLVTGMAGLLRQKEWALSHEELFRNLASRFSDRSPLSTFDVLGSGGPSREEAEVARLSCDMEKAVSREV